MGVHVLNQKIDSITVTTNWNIYLLSRLQGWVLQWLTNQGLARQGSRRRSSLNVSRRMLKCETNMDYVVFVDGCCCFVVSCSHVWLWACQCHCQIVKLIWILLQTQLQQPRLRPQQQLQPLLLQEGRRWPWTGSWTAPACPTWPPCRRTCSPWWTWSPWWAPPDVQSAMSRSKKLPPKSFWTKPSQGWEWTVESEACASCEGQVCMTIF